MGIFSPGSNHVSNISVGVMRLPHANERHLAKGKKIGSLKCKEIEKSTSASGVSWLSYGETKMDLSGEAIWKNQG